MPVSSGTETIRDKVLGVLRTWAVDLTAQQREVDGVYLFGSLVFKGGQQFVSKSDVDIVVRFASEISAAPIKALHACESLLKPKRQLERQLADILGRPAGQQRVSTVLVTEFELNHDIHKDGKALFYSDSDFINLLRSSEPPGPLRIQNGAELTFRPTYFRVIDVLQRAQKYRNSFLAIGPLGPEGECGLEAWEDADDPVPKEMMREAAKLRHFALDLKDRSFFDVAAGLEYLNELVKQWGNKGAGYAELADWLSVRRGARGSKTPLLPSHRLLMSEILACETAKKINERLRYESPTRIAPTAADVKLADEAAFLALAAAPSLQLGRLNLESKLFPPVLWDQKQVETYVDHPEEERQVELVWVPSEISPNLLEKLVAEMESTLGIGKTPTGGSRPSIGADALKNTRDVYTRLTEEGSNAYPRLAGNPRIVPQNHEAILQVPIGPSKYGVALIREKNLDLPTAKTLSSRHILNSLAVRVAYVFEDANRRKWIEFQERAERENATYSLSWDVSAAGYIDPQRHEDPKVLGRVSPSEACASELAEELRIKRTLLPNRDNFYFLGVGRNDPTGQLDLLAYCLASEVPEPRRAPSPLVKSYDRCILEPEAIAAFVRDKRRWVPTALLTLILTLEACGRGRYTRRRIEEAFAICVDALDLNP